MLSRWSTWRSRSGLGLATGVLFAVGLVTIAPGSAATPAAAVEARRAEARLTLGTAQEFDRFGTSVAISGDQVVVGAPGAAGIVAKTGAAYIYERVDGRWAQTASLLADDGRRADGFGQSVAIDGDRVAVGAYLTDRNGVDSGSVYVFERSERGEWVQTSQIVAADGAAEDEFGRAVSLDDEVLAVGAAIDGDHGRWSGSVYVYRRAEEGQWDRSAKLTASDAAADDFFGTAVAVHDDRVVVGAGGNDDAGSWSGSAYVFESDGAGRWAETAKLVAGDGGERDFFGESVGVSGDVAVIGSRSGGPHGFLSGAAYVFTADQAGAWTETTKLVPPDGVRGDGFGWSVAVSGRRVIVGSLDHPTSGAYSGAAYVFEADADGEWSLVTKIAASDGDEGDGFGAAVAIDGESAVVGASEHDGGGVASGSSYVYERGVGCGGHVSWSWMRGGGVMTGTNGDDLIMGSMAADVIRGGAGHDIICGYGGDDRLVGGPGDDALYAWSGTDVCRGSAGTDRYFGCDTSLP